MPIRLAILVSHPIQHFAPWHCEVARARDIDLKVFFCCDWGVANYVDPQFKVPVQWDIPLLEGYDHKFLPIAKRPERMSFWQLDNPSVAEALDDFQPDVIKLFGYAHRTNWRVLRWAGRNRCPILIYSDSNAKVRRPWWKQAVKDVVVQHFYSRVDGALYVGDNNRDYHLRYGIPEGRLFPGSLPIQRQRLLDSVPDKAGARRELRRQLGIPQDAFVIIFCGKYAKHKRPLDLVIAAHRLAARNVPVWAMLVGEGPERSAIQRVCRREEIRNVTLTGFVNQSRIPLYFATGDVLAMTSVSDPHPLVISEGATFGLPVIVSDRVGCIGPNDTARPDRNAIVYRCGDIKELAGAIETLHRDPDLYRRMSEESVLISASQDVAVAARQLADAVTQLHNLGPRRSRDKKTNSPLEQTSS